MLLSTPSTTEQLDWYWLDCHVYGNVTDDEAKIKYPNCSYIAQRTYYSLRRKVWTDVTWDQINPCCLLLINHVHASSLADNLLPYLSCNHLKDISRVDTHVEHWMGFVESVWTLAGCCWWAGWCMTKQTRRAVVSACLWANSAPVQFLPFICATAPDWSKSRVTKLSLTLKLITQGILCKTHELSLSHCSLPGRSSLCLSSATALKLPHPKRPMGKNAMGFICFGSSSSQNHKDGP